MRYNIVKRLKDSTISSKVDVITYLIKRAEKKNPNEEFEDTILKFLSQNEKISYLGNYCLFGPKYALGCLIGRFIYHYIFVKNFKKQIRLLKTLSQYLSELQPSQNRLLKKTTAIKLIDIVIRFGLQGYFLRTLNNLPLSVYFIPYKHAKFNAAYHSSTNSIVSYRPKEKDLSPEYIFVHEIGHLLIFNLTGNPKKVPDSFIEFNRKFNPSWKGDLVEVFVDLFSIAVMMETELATKNPFLKMFSVKRQKIIRNYFTSVINIELR
jgi:hypothetical protein